MAYKPSAACIAAASKAARGIIGTADLEAAFQDANAIKQRLIAEGKTDGLGDRLRDAASQKAERTRIEAAMRRRHAGLNALVRDRIDATMNEFKKAGLKPHQGILALMEGSETGAGPSRVSTENQELAYRGKFLGSLLSEIERDRPHLLKLLTNNDLANSVEKEMVELRQGGSPGITKNDDAKYLAKVFATYGELGRTTLNRLGASIGKLDGRAGAQIWNDLKLINVAKPVWVETIGNLIDLNRSFPDVTSAAEVREILGDIYDTIITGMPSRKNAAELGKRVNPANLAKSLGKSRVLHFKNADAARIAREQFGYGNTITGILAEQHRMARMAAQMHMWGPNPEVMFEAVVESERRKLRDDPNMPDKQRNDLSKKLNSEAGKLRHAFDVMSGTINRPVNVTGAKISSDILSVQSMAKLGAATFTAVPTDTMTAATAGMFRGGGFFRTLGKQLDGVLLHRPKQEQKELAYLAGVGYDTLIGNVVSSVVAHDGPVGKVAEWLPLYFKANFLGPMTDHSRVVNATIVAAEMGMRAKTAFKDLPPAYSHLLSMNGITEAHWEALRQAKTREVNGNDYITPDAVLRLPDAAVEPLVRGRLAALEATGWKGPGKPVTDSTKLASIAKRRAELFDEARSDLSLAAIRLVADEINHGILVTTARSRRTTTLGLRKGTIAGEAARHIMLFKGFPTIFAQRVLGRALFGHAGTTKGQRLMNGLPHLGAILAGMTVAGYMSLTMKDIAKGNWPPRNPFNSFGDFFKVLGASMLQGGSFGIYGDFLFGQVSRYGQSSLETLLGPTFGTISQMYNIATRARTGVSKRLSGDEGAIITKAGDWLNLVLQNTPGASLFYVRPALDVLFLNSLREAASPGYLHRQETQRLKDYGQTNVLARHSAQPFQ